MKIVHVSVGEKKSSTTHSGARSVATREASEAVKKAHGGEKTSVNKALEVHLAWRDARWRAGRLS